MEQSTIIIADDNPRDREYITSLLTQYNIIETDGSIAAALEASKYNAPYIITDIQMPEKNGIELAKSVWQEKPDARILFWTNHGDETYVRSLSKIIPPDTVYGYILKNNPVTDLIEAVISVFDDCCCWIDPKLRPVQSRTNLKESSLNQFEYDVLIDIALGLTDNMIAKRHYLTRRGAQNRIKTLYQKLLSTDNLEDIVGESVNLRTRTITIALRRGLLNSFELEKEEQKYIAWINNSPNFNNN